MPSKHSESDPTSTKNYRSPDDWDETGDPQQVFAPGHFEEWDMATNELREILTDLETIDWESWEDVAEAEEIIDNRLSEIQGDLHDALDSVRRAEDV